MSGGMRGVGVEPVTAVAVRAHLDRLRGVLSGLDAGSWTDRERIEVLAELTATVAALGAGQARLTVAYADSQRALGATIRGIAAEVGVARRVGLSRASDLVARSRVLVEDLPETMALFEAGELTEERAAIVADRVAGLDPMARELVDAQVAGDLPAWSDREVRDGVDRAVMTVDVEAAERRRAAAFARRRVAVRPVGDGMADLTIRCALVDAASMLTSLRRAADLQRAMHVEHADGPRPDDRAGLIGDGRTREASESSEQVMADLAVAWLTGREVHEGPPVEVQLVMPVTGLFADPETGARDDTPAQLVGIGPLPAAAARELIGRDTRTGADRRPAGAAGAAGAAGGGEAAEPADRLSDALFEGADWDLDAPDAGRAPPEQELARARHHEREATRVTVRRAWTTPDGHDLLGIESGRWTLPEEVRAALRPDPERSSEGACPAPPGQGRFGWLGDLARPPAPGELVDLESSERCYRGLLRWFVVLRDQRCRAPWCGAPIRHLDHARPHRDLPVTTAAGGIGLCAGHNHAKESPGHVVTVTRIHPHTIVWRTPTGRTHASSAPPVLGRGDRFGPSAELDDRTSPLEARLAQLLDAA